MQEEYIKVAQNQQVSTSTIITKYGLISAISLLAFFGIMKLAGLALVTELRLLNFIILFAGVFMGLREFFAHHEKQPGNHSYLKGFSVGVRISAIAASVFTVLLYLYLKFVDLSLATAILESIKLGNYSLEFIMATVLVEGILSGVTITFISMQYYK